MKLDNFFHNFVDKRGPFVYNTTRRNPGFDSLMRYHEKRLRPFFLCFE